jgi:hypothetical protein
LPIGVLKRAASHFRNCTLPDSQSNPSGSGVSSLAVPPVSYGPVNQMGINAYATWLGIPSQDIFGLIYLVYLCACGALLVIFLVFGLILQVVVWVSSQERKDIWRARRFRWAEMASNNSLRIMVLALGTLATFSFFVSHTCDQFMNSSNMSLSAMDSALCHWSRVLPLSICTSYHPTASWSGLLLNLAHR